MRQWRERSKARQTPRTKDLQNSPSDSLQGGGHCDAAHCREGHCLIWREDETGMGNLIKEGTFHVYYLLIAGGHFSASKGDSSGLA